MRHIDRLDLATSLVKAGLNDNDIMFFFETIFQDYKMETTSLWLYIIRKRLEE
jgi:hypothetical protein